VRALLPGCDDVDRLRHDAEAYEGRGDLPSATGLGQSGKDQTRPEGRAGQWFCGEESPECLDVVASFQLAPDLDLRLRRDTGGAHHVLDLR
jgi:hypothetical protein